MILGAFLFFIIGAVLSLLGSGGALLTIPVLVYIFDVNPYWATSYSMFIMGISNWLATLYNVKRELIHYKVGLYFAIPGVMVTFFIRRFILPIIPDVIFQSEVLSVSKGSLIMLVFSFLIFYTAVQTLKRKVVAKESDLSFSPWINVLQGAGVGIVTGLMGAGGGFLIVPVLFFMVRIPMKEAIATSLFIISITTSLGFLGDFNPSIRMDWPFLIFCVIFSALGVLIAGFIKDRFSNKILRLIFGYFILGLSILIFLIEMHKLRIISF